MTDDALTTAIRGVLASSPFHGEGHRKVWARLRQGGTRTSLRRVLRLMRQSGCNESFEERMRLVGFALKFGVILATNKVGMIA